MKEVRLGFELAEVSKLILDDLRPSCIGLSDLLKMLDNHTSSSVKSRYYNKVLECKLIIITSIFFFLNSPSIIPEFVR